MKEVSAEEKERIRKAQSEGGKKAQRNGRSHKFSKEEAAAAGRKSAQMRRMRKEAAERKAAAEKVAPK